MDSEPSTADCETDSESAADADDDVCRDAGGVDSYALLPMLDRFPVPTLARSCWRPAADVYRTSDGWLIKIELAGVHPSDVSVTVSGCNLSVSGQRRDQVRETAGCCQSLEITYDRFERTFSFPCPLAEAGIQVRFEQGMLLVEVQNCPSSRGSDAA